MCPIGTVIRPGMTGTKIPNAFKTDDYCMPGQSDIDLTSLWCGKGFEGENGVCHDIDECESMETFWKCQGMQFIKNQHTARHILYAHIKFK